MFSLFRAGAGWIPPFMLGVVILSSMTLPGLNFTTLRSGMKTSCFDLGLRAMRPFRSMTSKTPKLRSSTLSPFRRASRTMSKVPWTTRRVEAISNSYFSARVRTMSFLVSVEPTDPPGDK